MSSFQAYVNGKKPATKKELREAFKADPASVWFEDASPITNRGSIRADQMQPSDVIVGPDVNTKRNWYANIRNGKVV